MKKISLLTFSIAMAFALPLHAEETDCWEKAGEERLKACKKIIKTKKLGGNKISKENLAMVHYNASLSYVEKRHFRSALNSYKTAIKLNPSYEKAYERRCYYYYMNKKFKFAVKDCLKTVELNSSNAIAHNILGNMHLNKGQIDQALESFNQAIAGDSKLSVAYSNRGIIHDARLKYRDAIKDYSKAIELDSENAKAYYNRAVSYYKLDKIDEAKADLEKVLELEEGNKSAKKLQQVLAKR